jgi:membrane-bound lytic murein transglycosylase B
VISTNKTSFSVQPLEDREAKVQLFRPVINKLVKAGVDSTFIIKLITDSTTRFDDKYIQIDVPFKVTSSSSDTTVKASSSKIYTKLVNDEAVEKISKFIETNEASLTNVQERYKVDKEILASLLWVETRHGDYLGYHHVASVYLCLALVDQPEFIEYNMKRLNAKYHPSKKDYVQIKNRLVSRSQTKAKWALNELAALYKIKDKLSFGINELYGSYAGAFGIPQFLPSSFNRFGIDGDSDGIVNLFNYNDAIYSCANYLNSHGFGTTESQQRSAIFAYNHSQKYVNTIMTLAKRVKKLPSEDSLNTSDTTKDANLFE